MAGPGVSPACDEGTGQFPFPVGLLGLSRAPHSSFVSLPDFTFVHFRFANTVQYYYLAPGLFRILPLQTSFRLTVIL